MHALNPIVSLVGTYFPFFVLNNDDPRFLWHYLGGADLSTIRDSIYNNSFKKLQHLISNYLLHMWVELILWLMNEFSFIFHIYVIGVD